MNLTSNTKIVFDLDDTLYSEKEFEKSGIKFVYNKLKISSVSIENLFSMNHEWIQLIISELTNITKDEVLNIYHNHFPEIYLYRDANIFLNKLSEKNIELSLITDGKSITQRNKLTALNITSLFKNIIISEEINSNKPSEINYRLIMNGNNNSDYIYIADNPEKDFFTPNKLGWTTICLLDKGQNVHKQNFNISKEYLPKYLIHSFDEIIIPNEY